LRPKCISSNKLNRFLSGVTDTAVAIFRVGEEEVTITAGGAGTAVMPRDIAAKFRESRGNAGGEGELSLLGPTVGLAGATRRDPAARGWFRLAPDTGPDRIALLLEPGDELKLTAMYLRRVWPLLREECLDECGLGDVPVVPAGQGWTLLDRFDVAVVILDARGHMYRLNAAAKAELGRGRLLKRGHGGIFTAADQDYAAFRRAIGEVATEEPVEGVDKVIFLNDIEDCQRRPVTLTRYFHEGRPTSFVVLMVPLPPRAERVEEVAQRMGLTACEARVALLIQRGLRNREAAEQAGLKEQTFNTYAKRVLAKLNVKGRAEVAQLLTWQAAGGRCG
jgi:DNA-binding CsgD family transcriptional regulator